MTHLIYWQLKTGTKININKNLQTSLIFKFKKIKHIFNRFFTFLKAMTRKRDITYFQKAIRILMKNLPTMDLIVLLLSPLFYAIQEQPWNKSPKLLTHKE